MRGKIANYNPNSIRRRSDYIIGFITPAIKQIQETHTAYSADTQSTRQSLNGRQLTCCL